MGSLILAPSPFRRPLQWHVDVTTSGGFCIVVATVRFRHISLRRLHGCMYKYLSPPPLGSFYPHTAALVDIGQECWLPRWIPAAAPSSRCASDLWCSGSWESLARGTAFDNTRLSPLRGLRPCHYPPALIIRQNVSPSLSPPPSPSIIPYPYSKLVGVVSTWCQKTGLKEPLLVAKPSYTPNNI